MCHICQQSAETIQHGTYPLSGVSSCISAPHGRNTFTYFFHGGVIYVSNVLKLYGALILSLVCPHVFLPPMAFLSRHWHPLEGPSVTLSMCAVGCASHVLCSNGTSIKCAMCAHWFNSNAQKYTKQAHQ